MDPHGDNGSDVFLVEAAFVLSVSKGEDTVILQDISAIQFDDQILQVADIAQELEQTGSYKAPLLFLSIFPLVQILTSFMGLLMMNTSRLAVVLITSLLVVVMI